MDCHFSVRNKRTSVLLATHLTISTAKLTTLETNLGAVIRFLMEYQRLKTRNNLRKTPNWIVSTLKWSVCTALENHQDKEEESAKQLKGTNIYLNKDFSDLVRQKRKELIQAIKEARQRGDIAYLRYGKLIQGVLINVEKSILGNLRPLNGIKKS